VAPGFTWAKRCYICSVPFAISLHIYLVHFTSGWRALCWHCLNGWLRRRRLYTAPCDLCGRRHRKKVEEDGLAVCMECYNATQPGVVCRSCYQPAELLHHTSYVQNTTVPLCRRCHARIHRTETERQRWGRRLVRVLLRLMRVKRKQERLAKLRETAAVKEKRTMSRECPRCGRPMVPYPGMYGGWFWNCVDFPKCR
jgi:hypothetical protein